jgi:RND family efflux transporter MFP subunit
MRFARSLRFLAALLGIVALASCKEENKYAAPPPPRVTVAPPLKHAVTIYLEATGNTSAVNSVDLVARIEGFLQAISYTDGAFVKAGTQLFTIEPLPYQAKLQQAQAAEQGAQAKLTNAQQEYTRQSTLGKSDFASQAVVQQKLAERDMAQAELAQDQANTQIAAINYSYTRVMAPFDGVVTAHLQSVGELVGNGAATKLATIVQLDPIYVVFNISEQDVLRIRAEVARRGLTLSDLNKIPVEIGLQTEQGYPHRGNLDYAAPSVDTSTGTLMVRGVLANGDRALLPGYFARIRVPLGQPADATLVPDVALGADQGGRYLLVVNKDNVVEQRHVQTGPTEGTLRVITAGLQPDDRVVIEGVQRAVPGQKVDPQAGTISPPPDKADAAPAPAPAAKP